MKFGTIDLPVNMHRLTSCIYDISVTWTKKIQNSLAFHKCHQKLANSDIYNKESTKLCCLSTVWVKKSPLGFSDIFFVNGWEFLVQILHTY